MGKREELEDLKRHIHIVLQEFFDKGDISYDGVVYLSSADALIDGSPYIDRPRYLRDEFLHHRSHMLRISYLGKNHTIAQVEYKPHRIIRLNYNTPTYPSNILKRVLYDHFPYVRIVENEKPQLQGRHADIIMIDDDLEEDDD